MSIDKLKLFYIYILTIVVFLGVDFVWLTKVAPSLYKENIGHLMAEEANLTAAGIFYLLFSAGLVMFVILPSLKLASRRYALIYGAAFGLVTYATFDLTSQAIFKDWPTKITIIDMSWGLILSATVSVIVYSLSRRFIMKNSITKTKV